MRTVPSFSLALLLAACADLTQPVERGPAPAAEPKTAAAPAPPPAPTGARGAQAAGERVTASHILIAYKGALRARPNVTRSKEEAQALAQKLRQEAAKGEDFGKLAVSHSDDPSAQRNQGSLGSFERQAMVKPFSDAAFDLEPGQISDVVETPFGFHVIKRSE